MILIQKTVNVGTHFCFFFLPIQHMYPRNLIIKNEKDHFIAMFSQALLNLLTIISQ